MQGQKMREKLHGLYVITDDVLTPPQTLLLQVEEALRGGAQIVQLRDKVSTQEVVRKNALALQELCRAHDALFVLNDDVELAVELGVDGLHVGKSDYHRIEQIRENFRGVLGVSCYSDVEFASEMEELGVEYVAFGSFFASPTKPSSSIVALQTLRLAKERLRIPICAIGGLHTQNIAEVLCHKPDMIALVSDIWKSDFIEEKCRWYKKALEF